jgi:hypothetical protein
MGEANASIPTVQPIVRFRYCFRKRGCGLSLLSPPSVRPPDVGLRTRRCCQMFDPLVQ